MLSFCFFSALFQTYLVDNERGEKLMQIVFLDQMFATVVVC